jgi:hypothetical protein
MGENKNFDIRFLHPFRDPSQNKVDNVVTSNDNGNTNKIGSTSYDINSYKWNNSQYTQDSDGATGETGSIVEGRQPVFIEITEFQPVQIFQWLKSLNQFYQKTKAVASTAVLAAKSLSDLGQNLPTAADPGEAIVNFFLLDSLPKNDSQVLDTPIKLIKEMFQGKYVARYELPYDPSVVYRAQGNNGWNKGQMTEAGEKSGTMEQISSLVMKNMPLDFPLIPEWKYDGTVDAPEIATEFILYNDSYSNLKRNFKFLHALASGAYWEQIDYLQRSPNVYNVHFPGYFEYYYCTMDIVIETIGNMRKLNGVSLSKDVGITNNTTLDNAFFPDAYKISITFRSLIPNNFNVYLKYLLNGKDSTVQVGSSQRVTVTSDLIPVINTAIAGLKTTANVLTSPQGLAQASIGIVAPNVANNAGIAVGKQQ